MADDVGPPQENARAQRLAKQLLVGQMEAPPSAWLMRVDLLRRT